MVGLITFPGSSSNKIVEWTIFVMSSSAEPKIAIGVWPSFFSFMQLGSLPGLMSILIERGQGFGSSIRPSKLKNLPLSVPGPR